MAYIKLSTIYRMFLVLLNSFSVKTIAENNSQTETGRSTAKSMM